MEQPPRQALDTVFNDDILSLFRRAMTARSGAGATSRGYRPGGFTGAV
ncbi:hypothetical protein [Corallococcus carmarthensis]|nr:hypothetical protein [Corallococcus carmarthensis]NOK16491.1 hypothetical protein [Corallococcus carmarthensis]